MGCAPLNMVVVLAAALAVLAVSGAPQSHLVEELPGQEGGVDFRQYAGYITVDASAGRALFYYFVTTPDSAQNNHNHEKSTDTLNHHHHHHHHHHSGSDPHTPLALWLNGGPGCSSIGGGAFTELGPFFPQSDGRGLIVNKYAWNKVSNIIFLESPAGVGWSYSNSTHDYLSSGDGPTATDTLSFLVEWFKVYPEYQHRPFYIIGESYAGHYIPQLASLLVSYKGKDGFEFNLKGIAIGNPLLRLSVDLLSTYTYLWSHGIIPDVVYNDIQKLCGFENFVLNIGHNNVSNNCYKLLNLADNEIGNYINNYDVLLDVCYPALIEQELRLRKKIAQISEGVDVCITSERNFYLNLPEVQKALHANVTALPYPWSVCSSLLNYSSEDPQIDMLPILKFLHDQGLRILIFSGDQDSVVPLIGTRTIIGELARELHLPTSIPYSAWYENHQVAGWAISYGENLTFATVRGAAHMVPYAQPARALVMFKSFINAQRLPSREH